MAERRASRDRRTGALARRGSSFVEVLFAMAIMAIVLVGILQMFSVSLIVNKGAAARTQMLFKCQQVVENIRYYYFVTKNGLATDADFGTTGIPALGTTTVDLPYDVGDPAYNFWGPDGANVIERPNGPYKISYTLVDDLAQQLNPPTGPHVWVITVSAVPTDVAGAARYLGISTSGGGKRVDYVAQFTQ